MAHDKDLVGIWGDEKGDGDIRGTGGSGEGGGMRVAQGVGDMEGVLGVDGTGVTGRVEDIKVPLGLGGTGVT